MCKSSVRSLKIKKYRLVHWSHAFLMSYSSNMCPERHAVDILRVRAEAAILKIDSKQNDGSVERVYLCQIEKFGFCTFECMIFFLS